jgi:hypothetical protein
MLSITAQGMRQFVVLCQRLNLFSEAIVAIDGSKFKAVNNRDKNFTPAKMQRRMAQIEESIARYLAAMDTADRAEPEVAELKKGRLQDKIAALREQMQRLKALEVQMLASPEQQLSLTDPDARSMKSRDGGIVGYNVQMAVDAKNHLIVAHEVITEGIDRDQLVPMAEQARAATGIEALTVVADRGYFKGEQVRQCEEAGITAIVPKTLTSNSVADGRFDKQDFIYIASDDEYRCPAGQRAIKRFTTIERGMTLLAADQGFVKPHEGRRSQHNRNLRSPTRRQPKRVQTEEQTIPRGEPGCAPSPSLQHQQLVPEGQRLCDH